MQRFMIEVAHESEEYACARVIRTFLNTGSHYLTHADWGCEDGDHRAWMIVEAEDREEARQIVPPPFRATARVVLLSRFRREEIDAILHRHRGVDEEAPGN
jgi:hypothetical protein